jgi:hypothetical protein
MSAKQIPAADDVPHVPDGSAAGALDGIRVVERAERDQRPHVRCTRSAAPARRLLRCM